MLVTALAVLGVWGFAVRHGGQGLGPLLVVAVICLAVFVGWVSPIRIYRESGLLTYQLDAGFFVVLALSVHPDGLLLSFGAATIASQIVVRRRPIKALFNVAITLASCCTGLAVFEAIAPASHIVTGQSALAAVIGGLCCELTNAMGMGVIMLCLGDMRVGAILSVFRRELMLVWTSIALGCVAGLAVTRYPWAALIILLPFIAFRTTLGASFHALHDHARLRGLLTATLDIQQAVGEEAVVTEILQQARSLLRRSDASLQNDSPDEASGDPAARETLAAPLPASGTERWLVVSGRLQGEPFDDADQGLLEALAAVGSAQLQNVSLYEERRKQQEQLSAITANLGEGVVAFDAGGRLSFINPAARQLLDLGAQVQVGPIAPATLSDVVEPALRVIASGVAIESERAAFMRSDGSMLPVEFTCTPIRTDAGVEGAVVTFRDISERLAFEEQLEFHAFRDVLTGLPNRRVFLDRLEHALYRSSRSGETLAVFFIDVDRFKVVNDSLGHQAGDQLLIAIANRLQSLTRPEDTLARFGGDEFTLLIEGVPTVATAEAVAKRMLEVVHVPVDLEEGRSVVSTISVGIALANGSSSPDDVLHNADVAMYRAKRRRAGQYALFDAEEMEERSADQVDLEAALRRAVAERSLSVFYQPLFAAATGEVVGAEALVRWRHPERGLLGPSQFIGLAEETGLVLELGEFVLDTACRMARYWQDKQTGPFTISVNLSAQQFQDRALVTKVRKALEDAGVEPGHLCLEITESLALQDIDRSISTLAELKALGVRMAIDDFGTGYSSLTYLKRFPVDVVKLDQSFVQDLAVSSVDAAIVLAVVDLARNLGLVAVAEGVETPDQMARLAEIGCPVLQGYLLARPMSGEDFSQLLDGWPEVASVVP